METPTEAFAETAEAALGERVSLAPTGPIGLPYRGPQAGGDAYRILLETSGEWSVTSPGDSTDRPALGESHLLELEYREIPTTGSGAREDTYLLSLDALHYKLLQQNPPALREIELGRNRLRVRVDGKEAMDLQGAQPKGNLTPQKLLGHIFAIVIHDEYGNPSAIVPRGVPVARRFLAELLVKSAIGYSRLPLPDTEMTPGTRWHARRFPASRTGALGLSLNVEYSLAGYETLDGVPCAFILLRASEDGEQIPSAAGFDFERVVATLSGSAWVELATSRVRRLVLEDEVRAEYSRGSGVGEKRHRLRHATRMLLELRDPEDEPETWKDGQERFGRR